MLSSHARTAVLGLACCSCCSSKSSHPGGAPLPATLLHLVAQKQNSQGTIPAECPSTYGCICTHIRQNVCMYLPTFWSPPSHLPSLEYPGGAWDSATTYGWASNPTDSLPSWPYIHRPTPTVRGVLNSNLQAVSTSLGHPSRAA